MIAPLAEFLLVVVVALLGDFEDCLAWAACTSFTPGHDDSINNEK